MRIDRATVPWLLLAGIPLIWFPYLVKWRLGLNSDSAIPYLMARHVFCGEFPLYYWAQGYLGATECYLGAGLMALFGTEHVWLIDLAPLSAYLAAGALLLKCSPPQMRMCRAFLLLAAPPGLFLAIVRPGFTQGAFLWLGFAALIALAPSLETAPLRRRAYFRAALAGLVLALASYHIPSAILGFFALVPVALGVAGADILRKAEKRGKRTVVRLVQIGLVIGIAQLHRVPQHFGPPPLPLEFAPVGTVVSKLPLLGASFLQFDPVLRFGVTTTGLTTFYSGRALTAPAGPQAPILTATWPAIVIGVLLAALVLAGVIRTMTELVRLWRGGRSIDSRMLYWCALLFACLAAFVFLDSTKEIGTARLLASMFLPAVVCVSAIASGFPRWMKYGLAIGWLGLVIAGHSRMLRSENRINADIDAAVHYVFDHDIDAGIGDYWLSYNIAAATRESMIVFPEHTNRYRPYYKHALSRPRLAVFEFTRKSSPERTVLSYQPEQFIPIERKVFGEVAVTLYHNRTPTPPHPPWHPPR